MIRAGAVALVAVAAAACGDDGGGDVAPDAAPPRVFGGDRPVELQVPPDLDGTPRPLLVILHGYDASGLIQSAYLGLADVDVSHGVFVLAPDGTLDADGAAHWNASDACCGTGPRVDDVAYLGGLVEDVIAAWPIDRSRVVLFGHSNGHFMAYRMACERGDLFTALGGLAGAAPSVDGTGCDPSAVVSAVHAHGTDDQTIRYPGGLLYGVAYPGAEASVAIWADKAGCAATRTPGAPRDLERDLDGAETAVEIADGCPPGVGVELWRMDGARHVPDVQPDFGTQVLDWLLDHPRP